MLTIELDLKTHCIETAARRHHSRLLSRYFQSKGDDADTEKKLMLLQKALAQFDFSALRTLHKETRGKSDARILLIESDDGTAGFVIDGRAIEMEPCLRK